jgi:hypothetical protein
VFQVVKVDNLVLRRQGLLAMPTTVELRETRRTDLPADEQAVVAEFSDLIRKHRHQDSTTLARLLGLAFAQSLGTDASRAGKLARAQMRGLEVRQQLAEAEGGHLSSEDAARLLGISKTAVLKRLAAGRLLAWREERLQAARFPRWQFEAHGQVLDGLEDVLEILNQEGRLDAWAKVLFFLQQQPRLDDQRPLDLLRQGKRDPVCLAARAYAE